MKRSATVRQLLLLPSVIMLLTACWGPLIPSSKIPDIEKRLEPRTWEKDPLSADGLPIPENAPPPQSPTEVATEVIRDAAIPVGPRVMSLEETINLALRQNRTLAGAEDRVISAELGIVSAESEFELKIRPLATGAIGGGSDSSGTQRSAGAGVSFDKKFDTGTRVSVEPAMRVVDDGDDRTEVGVNIRQPLLKGLSREYQLSNVKSAEFGLRSANRSLYLTQVDLILQTVATVYEIIRQREFVRLNEESAGRLRGFVQATQAKERAGLASAIDVYRATLELNEAEDNLITAREDYQDVLDRLKLLLDVPITEELDVEAPLAYSIYAVDEQIAVLLALENRVELEQMSDTVEEARRRVRNAKHGLLPDFDLILDYVRFGQDENVANSAEFDRYSWTVGVASTSDVFRTSERVAYRQTQLGLIAAQRSQDVLEDDIVRQVKQRIRTLQRSQERIDLQSDGVKQAEGQMELALTKFQQGLASNFDLIEAESELRRAELDLISAVIDYIVGTYRLRAELGTLLEEPETW